MADPFAGFAPNRTSVPPDWLTVTPSATPLVWQTRAIRVATGGTVTVTTAMGTSRVMNFADGETRLIAATAITAATATGIEIINDDFSKIIIGTPVLGNPDVWKIDTTLGSFPAPPNGYAYLIDSSGNYLVDSNGAYLIGAA